MDKLLVFLSITTLWISTASAATGSFNSVSAAYTAAIYGIEPDRDGGFRAWNARQELTARFGQEGIQVESLHGAVGLRLAGWGYGNALSAPTAPTLAVNGQRIEYRRGSMIEWYVNNAAGIEQGFILSQPPGGAAHGAPLTIALAWRGNLQPELTAEGPSILFRSGGEPELRYTGLKAWDASGRDLPARLQIAPGVLSILVDDTGAAYPITVDPVVQQAKVTASDGAASDNLGYSVAVSGDTAVAGAPNKNSNTGAAYVFVRSGSTWAQQAKLTAADAAANDYFGISVSANGDTAVIGAIGKNGLTGAAYVFVRSGTTWSQQTKLTASDGAANDQFGTSVSINGDTAVVGAPNKNSQTGAAYVFVRSGTTWSQQMKLTASDAAGGDQFGISVSVSGDTVAAGAYVKNSQAGAAYVFVRSGTTWSQQRELTASDAAAGDQFGVSVSVSADTLVAGAFAKNSTTGAAYVFVRSGTTWTQQTKLTASDGATGDRFGTSVSVSGDTAAAGAPGKASSTGAAYVFVRTGTAWTQEPKLLASDGAVGDQFGGSVSVDVTTVVLGAVGNSSSTGAAYVFVINLGTTPQTITFGPLSNRHPGDAPFAVSATASSGLAVSFASNTPTVCTVSGSTVTILISGGCSITATQNGDATFAPAPPVTQRFTVLFADVDPASYYFNAVNLLAQQSITAGCGNNNYCPTQNVTRAQMAIFMVRSVYGSDNFTSSTTPYFNDVAPGDFAFKWIQKMKELGITAGCGSGNYCPNDSVTRDQMAIFIERARLGLTLAGSPPTFTFPSTPYFTDVPNSDFGFQWVQRLKLDNITAGCGGSTFCPNLSVTRGDMAIFIMRGAFNQLLPAGTPILTQISPSVLARGASATFTIVGANTNFVQGTTSLSPIAGVTIGAITVNSPTMMTVQLTAASNATPQPYSILAITGNEQAVLPNGLVVQ